MTVEWWVCRPYLFCLKKQHIIDTTRISPKAEHTTAGTIKPVKFRYTETLRMKYLLLPHLHF